MKIKLLKVLDGAAVALAVQAQAATTGKTLPTEPYVVDGYTPDTRTTEAKETYANRVVKSDVEGNNHSVFGQDNTVLAEHGSGYCNSCRDRTGTNNPFYGRKHPAETIEKLRTINKHRVGKNNPTSRKIYADGLVFDSATECAKHFGKCVSTITHRVKNPNYPNFYYL